MDFEYTHPTHGPIQVYSRPSNFPQKQRPQGGPKYRLYADMCGDLWHFGHGEFLMRAIERVSEYFHTETDNIEVVVGLYQDSEIGGYKRTPVLTIDERIRSALCCFFVDKVVINIPIAVSKDFLDGCHVDMVVHGDDFNDLALQKYYKVAMRENKFMKIFYGDSGISSTKILERTQQISKEKGEEAKSDLKQKIIE